MCFVSNISFNPVSWLTRCMYLRLISLQHRFGQRTSRRTGNTDTACCGLFHACLVLLAWESIENISDMCCKRLQLRRYEINQRCSKHPRAKTILPLFVATSLIDVLAFYLSISSSRMKEIARMGAKDSRVTLQEPRTRCTAYQYGPLK